MKRYHKWNIYRNVIMLRYLFCGCDGLRQHVQMMRWIHDKGLTEVFDLIEEHFKETWTMSNEECMRQACIEKEGAYRAWSKKQKEQPDRKAGEEGCR